MTDARFPHDDRQNDDDLAGAVPPGSNPPLGEPALPFSAPVDEQSTAAYQAEPYGAPTGSDSERFRPAANDAAASDAWQPGGETGEPSTGSSRSSDPYAGGTQYTGGTQYEGGSQYDGTQTSGAQYDGAESSGAQTSGAQYPDAGSTGEEGQAGAVNDAGSAPAESDAQQGSSPQYGPPPVNPYASQGQYGAQGQYGSQGQYSAQEQYGAQGQYGAPGQYATPGQYGAPGQPQYASAAGMSPSEEKNAGMWAHLSGLGTVLTGGLGGWVGPLIVYLMYKDRSPFAKQEAREALNFNLFMTILFVGLLVLGIIGSFVFVGIIVLMFAWVPGLLQIIFSIIGALRVSNGGSYQYPFNWRMVK